MNLGLEGKRFVVCGGSTGIGRAVAAELVAEGASVLLVARTEEPLARAVAELGENAHALEADLSTDEGIDSVHPTVFLSLGGLDGVFVACGEPPAGRALELGDDEWLAAYRAVIGGPVRLLRSLVPVLMSTGGGSVLLLASSAVRQPVPGHDPANVLRPGVAALAKVLAREFAPDVRVNALAPGRIGTERVRVLERRRAQIAELTGEEAETAPAPPIPLGREGEPAEVGRVAAFLLSPAASYVTGTTLQVDGGSVTAVP